MYPLPVGQVLCLSALRGRTDMGLVLTNGESAACGLF